LYLEQVPSNGFVTIELDSTTYQTHNTNHNPQQKTHIVTTCIITTTTTKTDTIQKQRTTPKHRQPQHNLHNHNSHHHDPHRLKKLNQHKIHSDKIHSDQHHPFTQISGMQMDYVCGMSAYEWIRWQHLSETLPLLHTHPERDSHTYPHTNIHITDIRTQLQTQSIHNMNTLQVLL